MATYKQIEIFSKPGCSACNSLKTLIEVQLKDEFENVSYYTVGEDVTVEQLTERLGFKPRAVPQVFIDGSYVGGYKQTLNLIQPLL